MDSKALMRRRGRVPAWWSDAKLGIFVHWVPASVPGFAPAGRDITELILSGEENPLSETPYSEWYQNSLRFPASSVSRFHRDHFGDRPYSAFAGDFEAAAAEWDPEDWAHRFAAAGARYVVLVAKHHDGWCLWPSAVENPNVAHWHSSRDLVGELAEAVRGLGMRFGVYYSGGYDWTFDDTPIGRLSDGLGAVPRGRYTAYATAQVRELVDRYRPAVLWNDIAWPSTWRHLRPVLEYYFAHVPDGVVNDRWFTAPDLSALLRVPGVQAVFDTAARAAVKRAGGLVPPRPRFFQHITPEYTSFPETVLTPWEVTRGMDSGFGYNRNSTEADFLTRDDLVRSFVDITAKGGNLLLNVGPRGEDARIPDEQQRRLDWLGGWMRVNGAAVARTRPWVRAHAVTPEGIEVRFTATGERLWALLWTDLLRDAGASPRSATLPVLATARTAVSTADGQALAFSQAHAGIRVELPPGPEPADEPVLAVALDHVAAAPHVAGPAGGPTDAGSPAARTSR